MAFEVVGRAVVNVVEVRREPQRARTISVIMPTGNAPEPTAGSQMVMSASFSSISRACFSMLLGILMRVLRLNRFVV